MGSKEREQHPLKDLKLSRRQFLKHAGLAAGSLIVLGAGVLETVGYAQEIDRVNKEVDRLYPPVPEDEFEKVKEQRRESWEKLNALAQEDNFEGISQFVSGEFQNTAQTWSQYRDWKEIHRSIASALIEARYPLIRIILDELSIWSGLIGGGIEAFISIPKLHVLGQREKEKKQMISVFHPEWTQTSPSRAEKAAFYQAVLSLPPVGGKYTVIKDGKPQGISLLPPSLTAEEQVRKMILLRQEGKLSQEGYIHQLTVQGRLPDEFKYAALALILAGPYQNNWQEPFYDAPWGSIAPLVHDGGKVKSNLNSFWNNVKGRTDFLHRVALVKEQKVEEIERLTPEECRRLSVEKLAAARAEQIERERLLLEVRFYQRIALALHCKLGGALEVIPENVRQVLTTRWQFFRERMDALLQEYDIHGACKVRWFTAKPRSLQRRDGRQEAKWPPIRKELIKLENVRRQHPEILDRAATLMEQVTKTIDQNLGLTPV